SNGPTLMGSHGPTSQVKHSFKVDGIKGAFAFSLELGENHEDDGKRWPTDEVERNARIERNKREALRHNNARAFEEQIIIKASHVREVCLTGTFGLNDDGTAGWVAPQELNAHSEKADLEETAGENESAAL
ncbi:MAG: hypothetical protein ACXVBE_16260, partial [Bdellovibrionota bacterium]